MYRSTARFVDASGWGRSNGVRRSFCVVSYYTVSGKRLQVRRRLAYWGSLIAAQKGMEESVFGYAEILRRHGEEWQFVEASGNPKLKQYYERCFGSVIPKDEI